MLFIEHVRASSRVLAACQDNLQPATLARLARQVDQKKRTGNTYRVLCRPSLHGREGELVALQAHSPTFGAGARLNALHSLSLEPSFPEMIDTWIEMAWQDGSFGWIGRASLPP